MIYVVVLERHVMSNSRCLELLLPYLSSGVRTPLTISTNCLPHLVTPLRYINKFPMKHEIGRLHAASQSWWSLKRIRDNDVPWKLWLPCSRGQRTGCTIKPYHLQKTMVSSNACAGKRNEPVVAVRSLFPAKYPYPLKMQIRSIW
jgi:hypothetical protein